jgi:hypothetical protein
MSTRGTDPTGRAPRRDRLVEDTDHDPYRARGKLADPTACPECGACFHEGRWTWRSAPADAAKALCPACRRIRDDYPGGYLTLEGDFLGEHGDEIHGLVRNIEERERGQHPLKRVMAIADTDTGLLVTTTDAHLAHSIGKAVRQAYQGELEVTWAEGESLVRATWRR